MNGEANDVKSEKFQTCAHADGVGEFAVYVKPSCPRSNMIRGRLVSSKPRCRECNMWKERDERK